MLCWPKAVDSDSKKVQHRNHGTQKKGKSRIVCDIKDKKKNSLCVRQTQMLELPLKKTTSENTSGSKTEESAGKHDVKEKAFYKLAVTRAPTHLGTGVRGARCSRSVRSLRSTLEFYHTNKKNKKTRVCSWASAHTSVYTIRRLSAVYDASFRYSVNKLKGHNYSIAHMN